MDTWARSGRGDGRASSRRPERRRSRCVLGFSAVVRLAGWDVEARTLWAFEVTLVVVALGLLGDLLRGGWSQGAVTGLVVDLGELQDPVTLRDRLARALGDRSLELGWWLGAERGYVDEAGRPFAAPGRG